MKLGIGMLCFNNLELSQKAVESFATQDVPHSVTLINNASTDGTWEWMSELSCENVVNSPVNQGITKGWNELLERMFGDFQRCDYALICNNDVILPSWFLRELTAYDVPLVTGIDTDNMADIAEPVSPHAPLVPYPDFSAFLIRRDTWYKVGRFDECMFNYCSDCDYHIRAHRLSIDFYKATVRYFHQRSSTINRADPATKAWMEKRADDDRDAFKAMYGCLPGTKQYLSLLDLV